MSQPFLSRKEAKIIQGAACLMIFACHFLTNYYFIEENKTIYSWCGLKINNLPIELHVQKAAQLCRALFAFISGYAIYVNKEQYKKIRYCLKKVCKLLFNYWVILFALYIIGWLFHEPMPSGQSLVYTLFGFGINDTFLCPIFAGYVLFYISLILLAPIWTRIFNFHFTIEITEALLLKAIFVKLAVPLIKSPMLYASLNFVFTYLGGVALCGYIVAQTDFFNKVKIKEIPILYLLTAVAAFFFPKPKSQITEILTAPIFIFSIVKFTKACCNSSKLQKTLERIGKRSFNMWIISCIAATPNGTFQDIFIWPRQAFLIFINAVFVCYMLSMPFSYLQCKMEWLYGKWLNALESFSEGTG